MLNISLGEAAALGTAITWAFSCQFHAAAGTYLGATGVALMRMFYSLTIMVLICLAMQSPVVFDMDIIGLLIISALAGVAICDTTFYKATLIIGPRLAALVQSMSSCFTATLGYIIFGERIGLQGALGIGIAVFGVFFVLAEGGRITIVPGKELTKEDLIQGCTFGIVSALMLSISFICLKEAIQRGSTPEWAGVVRVTFGMLFLAGFAFSRGILGEIMVKFRNTPKAWWLLMIGGLCGTLGIWLSGVAMQNTEAGVAATLIAMEPIFIIPVNSVWDKRLPSFRAVIGTIIAFIGIAIMIARDTAAATPELISAL